MLAQAPLGLADLHPFRNYVNPRLGEMLSVLNVDKRFVRGEGCYLFDADGRRYLDFLAAYGALPFGHNPPEIWSAVQAMQASGEPALVQPSALDAAGELAERLLAVAPGSMRYVTFTNSGAETVEAAIKLARATTGRLGVVSTENGFHGKTLAALSATHRLSYQRDFGVPFAGFASVPYGDLEALRRLLDEHPHDIAAFLVEPIQGEGGIVEPPPGYLPAAREVCRRNGVLFIADEIQTGLGRTGRLFACEAEGVEPDVLLLSKALGGGLIPIGAMLATQAAYCDAFAEKHSSTFAGNTLACRVGLRALDLLTRDDQALVRAVAERGARLKHSLEALRTRFPNVLRQVRGRGFLLGLQFGIDRETYGRPSLLGVMAAQETLTPVLAAFLLNNEGLRVAPTLNGADVVRIEPPLTATDEHCRFAIDALGHMLEYLAAGDTAALLSPLLDIAPRAHALPAPIRRPWPRPSGTPDEGRFAFLVHPVDLNNYPELDAGLGGFELPELDRLAERFNDLLEPFVVAPTRIVARDGRQAYGEFIVVARTAQQLLRMPREQALGEVRGAVELARDRGARIVGLGAYTSVVTRGGLHARDIGVPLTTGNSFTVVTAVDAVNEALTRLGTLPGSASVAMVGATGAIGRATAILLAGDVGRLILIGNPARPEVSRRRLEQVALQISGTPVELARLIADGRLVITNDTTAYLPEADVVVTATSSTAELVMPANLKFGAIVCDLSRPANVSRLVRDQRPDVLVIDGGIVAVPGRPNLGWSFGFGPGLAYACMAETMMLGLAHHYEDTSLGADLNPSTIRWLRGLAAELGFSLAQLRSFDRPLSDAAWSRLLVQRARGPRIHLAA